MMNKRLDVLVVAPTAQPTGVTLSDVLYAPPNPDRSRKACGNCMFWMMSDEQCFLHDADVIATVDTVCGYHVYGRPTPGGEGENWTRKDIEPVLPEYSGIEQIAGGSSCDRCRWYQQEGQTSGLCLATIVEDEPDVHPPVDALGCCSRFDRLV